MGRLLLEVPSINTDSEYPDRYRDLRVQKGRSRRDGSVNSDNAWYAEVVATDSGTKTTAPTTANEGSAIGGLPPIQRQGEDEYVQRYVVEVRHSRRDYLDHLAAHGPVVYDDNSGSRFKTTVLKRFDMKKV